MIFQVDPTLFCCILASFLSQRLMHLPISNRGKKIDKQLMVKIKWMISIYCNYIKNIVIIVL